MNFVAEAPERLADADADADSLVKLAAGLARLGAWVFDLRKMTITWSDEVRAIHEVAPGFVPTPAKALEFFLPHDRPVIREAFTRCAKSGHPYDLQLRIRTARGRTVWVRAIGKPAYDSEGAIVSVHGAFQDISPLVQVHEEKRLLAEQLNVTLESMTSGFYVLDPDWRVTYANSETVRVMGMPRDQVLGRVLWELFPQALDTNIHHEFTRALRTQQPVEFETYYEPLGVWVQMRAYPSSFGLAVAFSDITSRRQAEEEVRRLNVELEARVLKRTGELQEANRDLEMFAYAIAHDLRTPLCAGKAFTYALEGSLRGALSDESREYLDNMRTSLRYMDQMTQSLLDLARLAQAELSRQKVNLSEIGTSLLAAHQAEEPARAVEIVVQRSLVVSADRVLISQVLLNLLGNAWKFTRGTRQARIEMGACRDAAGERAFFVKDNGAGFDMQAARRLFDPFVRLHSQAEFDGTGIGLATVHKIITRHGGRVWAEAAVGRGACFYFTVPAAQASPLKGC